MSIFFGTTDSVRKHIEGRKICVQIFDCAISEKCRVVVVGASANLMS